MFRWLVEQTYATHVPTIAGLPRFNGGLVGYFGYDCVRYVEKRLGKSPNPDPLAGRPALPRSAQVQFALSHQHINADARCHRCPNAPGLCDPRA